MLKVVFLALAISMQSVQGKYLDMTWVMDMDRISYFPLFGSDEYRFQYHLGFQGLVNNEFFLAYNRYSTVEHMGTHIDAPYHFDIQGLTLDKIPLDDLHGPLVKIDITRKAKRDSDAVITVQDLLDWEEKYGRIPDGAIILMMSGWEKFYGDNLKYVGTNDINGEAHSPGFAEETAVWLRDNRKIKGLAADTLNCDAGNAGVVSQQYTFPVHEILLPTGVVCIENVKNVKKVPECGAHIFAFPILLKNSTGGQARVFSEWTDGEGYMTDCKGTLTMAQASALTAGNNAMNFTPSYFILLAFLMIAKLFE